jgi:hypothetical protein
LEAFILCKIYQVSYSHHFKLRGYEKHTILAFWFKMMGIFFYIVALGKLLHEHIHAFLFNETTLINERYVEKYCIILHYLKGCMKRIIYNSVIAFKIKQQCYFFFITVLVIIISACSDKGPLPTSVVQDKAFRAKRVIVVVIDGPRYTETWGDPDSKYIPNAARFLKPEGTFFSNFYNEGGTYTSAGHTAITTGNYERIENTGEEFPKNPSIFQLYLENTGLDSNKSWIVASKGKLHVLSNTENENYRDNFRPSWNCGTDGKGNGYRVDSLTLKRSLQVLQQHKPNLMLINFREPDVSGHLGNWEGYLKGIESSDQYVWELWTFIQNHPYYANKTALLITNDHGRHLNGRLDQYISHGDGCEGCRHISLLALGPDFKKGLTVINRYNQTDLTVTIGKLLQFEVPDSRGKAITELLN